MKGSDILVLFLLLFATAGLNVVQQLTIWRLRKELKRSGLTFPVTDLSVTDLATGKCEIFNGKGTVTLHLDGGAGGPGIPLNPDGTKSGEEFYP